MLLKYLTASRSDFQQFHAYLTLHVASVYGGWGNHTTKEAKLFNSGISNMTEKMSVS